jgi:isopenicillin N synthase-like dioxygenase
LKNDPVILPRMFRYPPKVDEDDSLSEDEHWGIERHSDYGLWTMIVSDGPGLEFEQASTGVWCPALYIPDSVGDVLDRLTSGRFVSSYHRARKNSHTSYRLSLPLFYDPAWDSVMQVLPISPEEEMQLDTPERAAR